MGLYIGKSSLTGSQMVHITTGNENIDVINNTQIPSTVFHSDLNILTAIVHNSVAYTSPKDSNYWVVDIPLSLIARWSSASIPLFQVVINGSVLNEHTRYNGVVENPYIYWNQTMTTGVYLIPKFTKFIPYYIEFSSGTVGTPSVQIIEYNCDTTGNFMYLQKQNNEIFISKDQFSIGGIDLRSINYVSNKVLNLYDYKYLNYSGEYTQIVNSAPESNEFELVTNNGIKVYVGAQKKLIFDSSVGYKIKNKIVTTVNGFTPQSECQYGGKYYYIRRDINVSYYVLTIPNNVTYGILTFSNSQGEWPYLINCELNSDILIYRHYATTEMRLVVSNRIVSIVGIAGGGTGGVGTCLSDVTFTSLTSD